MPTPKCSLDGKTYGRLLCTGYAFYKKGFHYWHCSCSCGNDCIANHFALTKGAKKSCGCLVLENAKKLNYKHGLAHKDSMYNTWQHIKQRCYNPENSMYKYYGGRGITLYSEWYTSYKTFHDYIISALGNRPSSKYTLDRIDNDKSYIPGNLRWATISTQQFNKRRLKKRHKYQGVRKTRNGTYESRICINRKAIQLGTFATEQEAVEAYNVASQKYHGSIYSRNKS